MLTLFAVVCFLVSHETGGKEIRATRGKQEIERVPNTANRK